MVRFAPGNDEHSPSFDPTPDWGESLSFSSVHSAAARASYIARVIEESGECLGLGDVSFAQHILQWFERHPELRAHLDGQTLVDLGCGRFAPQMAEFARDSGVRHYIGVDLEQCLLDCSVRPPQSQRSSHITEVPLPCALEDLKDASFEATLVQADLLYFVSQLPSSSVSITINGIDLSICRDERFHLVLAEEIARAASPRGIVFGSASESLAMLRSLTGTRLKGDDDSGRRGLRIAPFLARVEELGEWAHITPATFIMPDDGVFRKTRASRAEGSYFRQFPASA